MHDASTNAEEQWGADGLVCDRLALISTNPIHYRRLIRVLLKTLEARFAT